MIASSITIPLRFDTWPGYITTLGAVVTALAVIWRKIGKPMMGAYRALVHTWDRIDASVAKTEAQTNGALDARFAAMGVAIEQAVSDLGVGHSAMKASVDVLAARIGGVESRLEGRGYLESMLTGVPEAVATAVVNQLAGSIPTTPRPSDRRTRSTDLPPLSSAPTDSNLPPPPARNVP